MFEKNSHFYFGILLLLVLQAVVWLSVLNSGVDLISDGVERWCKLETEPSTFCKFVELE